MKTDASPGTFQQVSLPQGTIRYLDQGTGPTLVFVHGILVNSLLWRKVIPLLSERFRCVAPDLPLGAHSIPLRPDADVTPPGVARLVADFLEALDLREVTLVGNDTGGAISQLVIARHPERIVRLVLTNCDAFEAFFPPSVQPFHYGARLLGAGFVALLAWLLRSRSAQRRMAKTLSYSHIEDAVLDAYFVPLRQRGVRRDLTRFLQAVSNRYTLEAAQTFPQFAHPVLLLWAKNDPFFPARLAVHLQEAFPDAALEFLDRSRAFIPEDQPEALARRIEAFAQAPINT